MSIWGSLLSGIFVYVINSMISLNQNLLTDPFLRMLSLLIGWDISCEIALIWMSLDFTNDQSTLVQVMAWCRQATSHYLSQCWPRSMSPNGITRPQWVNKCCKTKALSIHCWLAIMPLFKLDLQNNENLRLAYRTFIHHYTKNVKNTKKKKTFCEFLV